MNENIDVPFLWLWSCKGSSNCLNLDQAVLHARCLPWLRSDLWSTKNGRHHVTSVKYTHFLYANELLNIVTNMAAVCLHGYHGTYYF